VITIEYLNVETNERHEGEPEGPVLVDGLVVKTLRPFETRPTDPWDVHITVTYRKAWS
jgi:hypothetical protein